MRIATWNVNSLKARQDALEKWLKRADPDVLLMQETKLADEDAPVMWFQMAGYELVHHGEGRWNGVAIASRVGAEDIVTNFGDGPVRDSRSGASGLDEEDFNPFDEARMLSAVCGGIRLVCLYAPNGRVVGSPFYDGKLQWFDRLRRWLDETRSPDEPLVLAGDYNVTPADEDVWDPVKAHGGTHVSEPEREALARLREWGLADGYRVGEPGGRRAASRGGTTGPGCSTATRACGSTCSTPRRRSRRGSPGRRSTGRRARARRSRPTTLRSFSTSTSRASRSRPAGTGALARIAARTKPSARKSPAQERYEADRKARNTPAG